MNFFVSLVLQPCIEETVNETLIKPMKRMKLPLTFLSFYFNLHFLQILYSFEIALLHRMARSLKYFLQPPKKYIRKDVT